MRELALLLANSKAHALNAITSSTTLSQSKPSNIEPPKGEIKLSRCGEMDVAK